VAWAKVDDRLFCHPKFLGVSLQASGLWLRALSYAASLERDGWFPLSALTLCARSDVDLEPIVNELLVNQLWKKEVDNGVTGYRIHDWPRYNRTRKQLERERKRTAARLKKYRACNAVGNGVTTPVVTVPPSRPVPSPSSERSEGLLFIAPPPPAARTRTGRAKPKTPWPEDFGLSPERAAYATRQGLEATYQWGKFQAHALRDDVRHANWDRAWEYWVRNAWEIERRHG